MLSSLPAASCIPWSTCHALLLMQPVCAQQEGQMMLVTELMHESLYDALQADRMTWYDGCVLSSECEHQQSLRGHAAGLLRVHVTTMWNPGHHVQSWVPLGLHELACQ